MGGFVPTAEVVQRMSRMPVFPEGHAPLKRVGARPDSVGTGRGQTHVPQKWMPVFREGHAPLKKVGARLDSVGRGGALMRREEATIKDRAFFLVRSIPDAKMPPPSPAHRNPG